MNTVAVAKHLNVVESAIVRIEEWANVLFCVVKGIGARFVSKKVVKNEMIQVECYKEKVVIDRDNQVGYVVRAGFDMGNKYSIKRFNPVGIDVRGLDFSTVRGEKVTDSNEYTSVISAIGWSKPRLIAYGEPGTCFFPVGYEEDA